jgi:hypothetical protein
MRSKSIDLKVVISIAASMLVIAAMAIEAPKPAPPPASAPKKEGPAETPPSAPTTEAPATEAPSTEGTDAAPAAVEEEEETLPPLPADAIPAGPPPARFNPTEKVRADFPVSFPIDI